MFPRRRRSREACIGVAERVIGALFAFALLVLLAMRVLPAVVRGARRADATDPLGCSSWRVVCCRRCGQEWGEAMGAELSQIVGRPARWRFSLGCLWAAVVIRSRSRERGGEVLRVVVLAGIAGALGLAG